MFFLILFTIPFLFYFLKKSKSGNIFILLIINGMIFGELSIFSGSVEEKLVFLFVSIFILIKCINYKKSKLFYFFPRGFDIYLTVFLFIYLFVQSVRSIITIPRGVGSLFWPIFFLISVLFFYIAANRPKFDIAMSGLDIILISRNILSTLCVYLLLISGSSILYQLGILTDSDYLPFRGTLLFTLTSFFPIVYIHYVHDNIFWKRIALFTGFLGLLGAILVSSRAALVPILFFYLLTVFGKKINLKFVIIFSISLFFFALFLFGNAYFFEDTLQTILDTFRIFSYSEKSLDEIEDLDRIIHYLATWELLHNDLWILFFGVGFRLSGFYLANPLAEYYRLMLPHLDFVVELGSTSDAYTFGWNGLLLDLGLVGLFLLISCFARNFLFIIKNSRGLFRMILLGTLFVFILRLFANGFSGWTIFYFLIIPAYIYNIFVMSRNAFMDVVSSDSPRSY